MNERIRKLMLEAGYAAPELAGRANKLAELIVRECMEQVHYTREDMINGNISQVIKDRIEKHFGVEE